ncbi:MAG: PAS domain S-box protein [Synechococcales cyanobacterium CRU_2_2]|nr:PAS domain S-box protein [Synechococcales cyanobacterium CRU_2_2]
MGHSAPSDKRTHAQTHIQKHAQVKGFLDVFRSRLSQRIVLAVFSSIVAIEAIILIPSIVRREQELLRNLSALAAAHLSGVFAVSDPPVSELTPPELLARMQWVQSLPEVKGGTLYTATGSRVGSFGELPRLGFVQVIQSEEPLGWRDAFRTLHGEPRYDARWLMSPLEGRYVLIIRHDTTRVRRELWAFVGRIAGLVLIISGVVTLATMVVLRSLLIAPILALRNDLQAAPVVLQEGARSSAFASSTTARRRDELGEVIEAFQDMYRRIAEAIAQRREAEQSLRESEARFRAVVNQAAEGILIIDPNTQIQDANQFALDSLGYSAEALLGRSILEINPSWSRDRFAEHWQALQAGEPVTFETEHRDRAGRTYPVEVRSGLIRMDSGLKILNLVRDISERKQAEQAQARLAEVGELAAMIVHEVRNPLATVLVALTGLKRLELPQLGQLRLELALEESERLQRLLNEILAYAREQRPGADPIELNALTEELCATLRTLPVAQGRSIRLEPAAGEAWVRGDRDKLKQVLINLLTNACEASPPGETISCQIAAPAPERPQVSLSIHNSGEPIPADLLPKLTHPFVSTKASGNGLGLAITQRIVEAHGGTIAIASSPEAGTTVRLLFPLIPDASNPSSTPRSKA